VNGNLTKIFEFSPHPSRSANGRQTHHDYPEPVEGSRRSALPKGESAGMRGLMEEKVDA